MWNWIIYSIPWEVKLGFWLVIALLVGGFVLRLFGVRWGLIVSAALAVVVGAATIYNKGQQSGYADNVAKDADDEKKLQAAADAARAGADAAPPGSLRDNSDGFRRD